MTVDIRDIRALDPLVRRVRTDITAAKTKVNGKTASYWTTDPLTDELLSQHLNGGPARGVCPLPAGGSHVLVALFDLDDHQGDASWSEMALLGANLCDVLELAHGCSPIAWRSSGGRGIHVMLVWDEPQDAYSVRQFMFRVLDSIGFEAGTKGIKAKQIEVFPKQDRVNLSGPGSNGNMFILPMAGASELLVPDEFSGTLVPSPGGREDVRWLVWDGRCPPVPVLERPVRVARAAGDVGAVDEAELLSALDAIPNTGDKTLDYDTWFKVMAGINHAYGGGGEELAITFSRKAGGKHVEAFLLERVWPYLRCDREDGITAKTIYHLAGSYGWVRPIDAGAFSAVVVAGGSGGPGAAPAPLPAFTRDRAGAVLPTATNAVMALRRPDVCGWRIGHDEFRDEITVAAAGAPEGDGWRPMTDADLVRIRVALEAVPFKTAPKELARDAAVLVAEENRYDSAQLWLTGLERAPGWDGVARCERFFVEFFGCEDTAYTRACGAYLWTALAGRVLDPGCQVDMAVTLAGDQGLRKSSAIAALVPDPQFFIEVDFADKEEDTARRMRGALVGEIAELRGLHTKDQDGIKKFMTRRYEKWIPKYKEFSTTFPRRIVFVGTVNPSELGFLADSTGNRRWLPLDVSRADVEGIAAAREQLWAEGAAMWRAGGVAWQAAERLAGPAHERHTMQDMWHEAIAEWLEGVESMPADAGEEVVVQPRGRFPVSVADVASGALGLAIRDSGQLAQKRIGAVLRKLGYEKRNLRINGEQRTRWCLPLLAGKK